MENVKLIVWKKKGTKKIKCVYPQPSKAEAHRKANMEFKGLRCQVVGGRGPMEKGNIRSMRSYSDMMSMRMK